MGVERRESVYERHGTRHDYVYIFYGPVDRENGPNARLFRGDRLLTSAPGIVNQQLTIYMST